MIQKTRSSKERAQNTKAVNGGKNTAKWNDRNSIPDNEQNKKGIISPNNKQRLRAQSAHGT